MTIAQNEMKESACNLHLTLLAVLDRCPACGWSAGDHANHPSNRKAKSAGAASPPADQEHLLQCIALVLTSEGFELTPWMGGPSRTLRVPRAAAEALDGTVEIRLTETDYELSFKPKR